MATVAPASQGMTAAADFDICNGEQRIMAFESFDLSGHPVHGLLTDRRIILRESSASCGFPLNACFVCFKAERDSSYSILDLKSVQPYVASGCGADCMATMFRLATTNTLCCCLPKMLPNGVKLGFSRLGDLVPSWLGSFGWPGLGPNCHHVHLQLHKADALKLRKLLTTHPNTKGLKYTDK